MAVVVRHFGDGLRDLYYEFVSRRHLLWSSWCLLLFLVVATAACGGDAAAGEATASNATAAYVILDEDAFVADDFLDPLTKAPAGEPSTPAGFIPGLRSTSVVRDLEGVFGVRIVFQTEVGVADRDLLFRRSQSLGLSLIWLGPDDRWPDCLGEADCQRVSEAA